MKSRTLLALVLIGLMAACGCRDRSREVTPDKAIEQKGKDKDNKHPTTSDAPELLAVQPMTEPNEPNNNEQEPRTEELGAPNVEKEGAAKEEQLGPPEVEKD